MTREELICAAEAAGARVTGIHSISYGYARSYARGAMIAPAGNALYKAYESAPNFNPEDQSITCAVQMQWRIELG